MSTLDDTLIDKCSTYVEMKDCHYLAKEGVIVQYMSTTGRKADYTWHKQTILESLRIIRAMYLSPAQAKDLREHHLIGAFQELERVYEFGVKTRHSVNAGVFNYTAHAEMSIGDEAMSMLVEQLQMEGYVAVLLQEVISMFMTIDSRLKSGIRQTDQRELMLKHFESAGFIVKTAAQRPLFEGKKQGAIMMSHAKPRDIAMLDSVVQTRIIDKIYRELI